ncbi:MAG TPA: FxLYD domain-containing protein [Bacillales bacterium]|nr:FxLYD domain-containing protein [Bacillales bacterium]
MKKNYLVIFVMVCLAMSVATGCGGSSGSTMQSDLNNGQSSNEDQTTSGDQKKTDKQEGKTEDELSAKEKVALNFYKGYESTDKATRKKAVNKYVVDKTKDLFLLGASAGPDNPKTHIKVMESTTGTGDDGTKYTLVLLHMTGQEGNLFERIAAVKGKKILFVYSPDSKGEFKKAYDKLRKKFDTPIPEAVKQRLEKQAKAKAKVEISQETSSVWKDSTGAVWANYSAIVKNTGDTVARIGSVQVNFKGKDGSVLGTSQMVNVVPDTIPAGGTAYITTSKILKTVTDPKKFDKATVNIDFDKTTQKPNLMKTSKVKFKTEEYGTYIVTGTVKNPTDQKADQIRIAAALFDKKGNLVGVLNGGIDVKLNPGGTAGFELEYPPLPKKIKGNVEKVKVKAYSWSF